VAEYVEAGIDVQIGDLADPTFLSGLGLRADVIVHAAATSGAGFVGVRKLEQDNVAATAEVVAFADRTVCGHLIALSTVSVHGRIAGGVISERTGFVGPDAYGFTKRRAELLVTQAPQRGRRSVVRLPGVLGPGAHRIWLAQVVVDAAAGRDINIYNPDAQFNNGVLVDDLVGFLSRLGALREQGADAFPIASASPVTIREIVEVVVSELGSDSRIVATASESESFIIDDNHARVEYGYTSLTIEAAVRRHARAFAATGVS